MWQIWPSQSGVKHWSCRKSCHTKTNAAITLLYSSQGSHKASVWSVCLTLSLLSVNERLLSFFQQVIWNSTLHFWQQISWIKPCKHIIIIPTALLDSYYLSRRVNHLKVWITEVDLKRMGQTVWMTADSIRFRWKRARVYKVLQTFLRERKVWGEHRWDYLREHYPSVATGMNQHGVKCLHPHRLWMALSQSSFLSEKYMSSVKPSWILHTCKKAGCVSSSNALVVGQVSFPGVMCLWIISSALEKCSRALANLKHKTHTTWECALKSIHTENTQTHTLTCSLSDKLYPSHNAPVTETVFLTTRVWWTTSELHPVPLLSRRHKRVHHHEITRKMCERFICARLPPADQLPVELYHIHIWVYIYPTVINPDPVRHTNITHYKNHMTWWCEDMKNAFCHRPLSS